MGLSATELRIVVRVNCLDREASVAVKGQDIGMEHGNGTIWVYRRKEETDRIRPKGDHRRMEMDTSDTYECTHKEGVLTEAHTGTVRFAMLFPEAGIRLLDQ